MSGCSETPWSNSPNAPQIPYSLHVAEKGNFVGGFIATTLYGIVIVLFFQCVGGMFDPSNRARGGWVKWGFTAHTTLMFLLATVSTAMTLDIQSISHIDNRVFPADGALPPGPLGYKLFLYPKAISLVPNFMFELNQWLADGLLLYRCYVICATSRWRAIIALPCLMYLTSLATGIAYFYECTQGDGVYTTLTSAVTINLGLAYFTVTLSLNVLLTLMIVIRLILHWRKGRKALGTSFGGQLYVNIVAMIAESCAIDAVSFLLTFGLWTAKCLVQNTFWPILFQTQVIAPLLILRRVAKRRALTSDDITSDGDPSSIRFRRQEESTDCDGSLPNGDPARSTDTQRESPHRLDAGADMGIEEVPL